MHFIMLTWLSYLNWGYMLERKFGKKIGKFESSSRSWKIFNTALKTFQLRLVPFNLNGDFLTSNFPTSHFFQLPFPTSCILQIVVELISQTLMQDLVMKSVTVSKGRSHFLHQRWPYVFLHQNATEISTKILNPYRQIFGE